MNEFHTRLCEAQLETVKVYNFYKQNPTLCPGCPYLEFATAYYKPKLDSMAQDKEQGFFNLALFILAALLGIANDLYLSSISIIIKIFAIKAFLWLIFLLACCCCCCFGLWALCTGRHRSLLNNYKRKNKQNVRLNQLIIINRRH